MSQQVNNLSERNLGGLPTVLHCSRCQAVLAMPQADVEKTAQNQSVTMAPSVSSLPRYFPFCSERCRLLDLGAWASGEHAIAGKSGDAAFTIEEV